MTNDNDNQMVERIHNNWVIIDFKTGAMDGFYNSEDVAQEALNSLRRKGATYLSLVKIVTCPKRLDMADKLFWCYHPGGFTGMRKK